VLGEQRQTLDALEDREGCDAACAADRPGRPQAKLAGREASLDPFADVEAAEDIFVRVQFDGRAADRAEKPSVDLPCVAIEERPADGLGLVRADIA
jgi:hypothetical protein